MILVTGSTGLLGSYLLLKLLTEGKEVKALIRQNSPKEEVLKLFQLYNPEKAQSYFDSIQWAEGDLLDISFLEEVIQGVTHVYHAAALVSFNERKKKQIIKTNIEGTQNLLNVCIDKNIEKFCFFSSIAVMDYSENSTLIDESSEWNTKVTHSFYACSKYGAEMEVWRASQEGLKVVILNPGIILGSSNLKRSALLFDTCYKKNGFYTSGTSAYVDAQDVSNIAFLLMENTEIFNQRFILISENKSYKEIVNFVRKKMQLKPANYISDFWLKKIGLISRLFPFKNKLYSGAVEGLIFKGKYSNEKIVSLLNYKFTPVQESLEFHTKNYLNQLKS